MASLDAVNTFDVDLSVARDREELHINSSSLWITLVDPSTQDAGSVILDLSSYYTDNSPINATTGFNIRSIRGLDRIYISNTAQPGKRLRINYSNTIIYRPYTTSTSSGPTPTPPTPSIGRVLACKNDIIVGSTNPNAVLMIEANPKRIWLQFIPTSQLYRNIINLYKKSDRSNCLGHHISKTPNILDLITIVKPSPQRPLIKYKGAIFGNSFSKLVNKEYISAIEFSEA